MNVNHGFYAGTIGAMRQEKVLIDMDRMTVYTNPAEAQWITQVVDRIKIYSDQNDAIFALPLNPIFYFLTDRVNPTPYEWVLPGMLSEDEELKMVETLRDNLPKVVVYVDIAIDGKDERRLKNYAPYLYKFLVDRYGFQEMIGLFQILLPKQ